VVDRALGVVGELTGKAAQMGLSLLVEMPSRRGSRMLEELCGVRISSATLDRLKGKVGPAARELLEREQEAWLAPVSPDRPGPLAQGSAPSLVVRQADAVKVRYRDGWHDVKVGVSYGLGEAKKQRKARKEEEEGRRTKLGETKYCALRGEAETLGRQLQALSLGQGLRRAGASQFLSDGGNWMRGLAQGALAWSEWTVDYYHVSQQVASALTALYGEGHEQVQRTHRRLRRRLLKSGGNAAARGWLQTAMRKGSLGEQPRRIVTNVIAYLAQFQSQTRYDTLRKRGWPIGSGAVEGGGCKLYIQGRFKRPGARWSEQGFDDLEALRRLAYNDQWAKVRDCIYSLN
jgi:hypothetical protein